MLDLDDLLLPVSQAAPAGEDLSFSTEYDAILEARRADDPSLEQGEWVTDLKTADWALVERQCAALLRQRSKDLRLAGWWAEARARQHGVAGILDGYRLFAALCGAWWDELYPLIEEGDAEQRIGQLDWLVSHSGEWLRRAPLTRAAGGSHGLADFEAASSAVGGSQDTPSPEDLEAARRETPYAFYAELLALLPACAAALEELEQVVDARLGQEGPSFTPLRDQLERVSATARRLGGSAGVPALPAESGRAATSPADPAAARASVHAATPTGEPASRREAIAQLRRVAEFFRRTEPHSPVAYLADKAANWGEMPLHAWLKQVIKDEQTLERMEEMLDLAREREH